MLNKILLWGVLYIGLVSTLVYASNVETDYYKIFCYPEVATIQYNGFFTHCEYQKKMTNYTGDVALCFDSTISRAKVLYNAVSDITSMFKYKYYDMVKGDCYYVEDIFWLSGETKSLDIWFVPTNDSASPKWDTYFGDISTSTVDLMLDPLYNSTTYKIGTRDSTSNYYWSNNGVDNADISSSNSYVSSNNISTIGFANTNYTSYLNSTSGGASTVHSGIRIRALQNTYLVGIYHSTSVNLTFNLYSDSDVLIASAFGNYSFSNFSTPQLLVKGSYYKIIQTNTNGTSVTPFTPNTNIMINITDGICNDIVSSTCKGAFTKGVVSYPANITSISSANISSNTILLSLLANSFSMSNSFTGSAFINITFDGINYNYLNMSNNSVISLTDNISDNKYLQYKILLLDNLTTINNVTINFNGLINQVNITVYDETNSSIITQNVTVTLTDWTNPNIVTNWTTSGRFFFGNLNNDLYEVKFSSINYSERRYYINVTSASSNFLNAYLLPSVFSNNYSLYVQSQGTQAVISNALVMVMKNFNSSWVTVAQRYTDVNGFATLYLQEGASYYVCIYAAAFDAKCFPFEFYYMNTPYYFRLTGNVVGSFDSVYNHLFYDISPSNTSIPLSDSNINVSLYAVSPDGLINWFAIYFPNGTVSNLSGSPSGGLTSMAYNFSSPGAYKIYFVIDMNGYPDQNISQIYNVYDDTIIPSSTLQSGFDKFKNNNSLIWTTILGIFFTIIAAITISQLSGGNPIATNITVILCIISLTVFGWFDQVLGTILGLIGLSLFFFNRQGGQ